MYNKNFVHSAIQRFASAEIATPAFSICNGKTTVEIGYNQFAEDIMKVAAYFRERNIIHQHIALVAPNSYNWVVTALAIIASGNVAVLMNYELPEEILYWQCEKADVSVICGEKSNISTLGMNFAKTVHLFYDELKTEAHLTMDEISAAEPDETIIMMFTSGTTGKSKAVEITSENLDYSIDNFKEQYTLPGMDRVFTPIPFYHILGFLHIIETLNYHHTVCIGRGIKYLFMDMAILNPTVLNTVPSIVDSLAKLLKNAKTVSERHKYIGSFLQSITFGGAVLNQATSKFLMDLGFSISVYYGMTEVSCTATWGILDREHAESAGKFCEYIRYRFQDGELMMTGPTLMKGYYKDEEETGRVIEGGWLHTGDLGYCDKDGFLYLTGRKKNVIILSNGENVNPEEIEATLGACTDILECMVYGDGKGICADVYAKDREVVQTFIRAYNDGMPMYRQIYKVNYSTEPLEKTGIGKIKRKENIYD